MEGAGAALLLAPGLIWPQLSHTHLDLYHRLLPITTVVRALAIDVAVLWVLGTMVVGFLDRGLGRGPESNRRNVWHLVWALWFGLLAARAITGLIIGQMLAWDQITPTRAFAVMAGLLVLLWIIAPPVYEAAVRGLRVVVLLLGCCIFWALPSLAAAGLSRPPRDLVEFHKPLPTAAANHRRIVWLLFDEMSWDQVFDHRWPGLDLPNLDNLRRQSVSFSDMQPDGYFTEQIIPSLFLGKPIAEARSTTAGVLRYQSAKGGPWMSFDGNATLFGDAHRDGWATGISGDYNPYCRMLADQLDFCWMHIMVFGEHLSRDKSTWANVTAPVQAAWARTVQRPFEPAPSEAEVFDDTLAHAREVVTNDKIDFAFVHLYLPHPPGFYNRRTEQVRVGGSYIDNLALADRSLGDLLQALAQTPSAGQTTLIISSDHGWRVPLWRDTFGWTREDELASGHGHFDPRPMLMVRFPGRSAPVEVQRPVPMLALHDIIERIMAGEIGDARQLEAWAAQQ